MAISRERGIAFSPTSLKVFQPFFMMVDAPYSVIRGELLTLRVALYLYSAHRDVVTTQVVLEEYGEICLLSSLHRLSCYLFCLRSVSFREIPVVSLSVSLCEEYSDFWRLLCDASCSSPDVVNVSFLPGESDVALATFLIKPTVNGEVKISLKAHALSHSDAIVHSLLVEAEGVSRQSCQTTRLEGKTLSSQTTTKVVSAMGQRGSAVATVVDSYSLHIALSANVLSQVRKEGRGRKERERTDG